MWTRGLQGALRWPAARVGRLMLLAVVAGLALRGAWSGTTPLIAVAGVALYLIGLDSVEALGQETDHPSRLETAPHDPGYVHVRHLPAAVALTLVIAVVGAAAAVAVHAQGDQALVAVVCAVPAALGAVAGGAVSVLGGEVSMDDTWMLVPPEAAGTGLVIRTALPPGLAIAGTLPVLAARHAFDQGQGPVPAAALAGAGVLVLFLLVAGWVLVRHDIQTWWHSEARRGFLEPGGGGGGASEARELSEDGA
jgi:hypothetical protein